MRLIGQIQNREEAKLFRDYLASQDIEALVEQQDSAWDIWIYDEDALPRAREELQTFHQTADKTSYQTIVKQSQSRRKAELDAALKSHTAKFKPTPQQSSKPVYQVAPLTILLIVISGAVAAYTDLGDDRVAVNPFRITEINASREYVVRPFLMEVQAGQVWRLVSPIFVHFGAVHLLFNMAMLYQFGLLTETVRGHIRFAVHIVLIAIISNVAQHLTSGPNFGGMSGVIYGLFGYLWVCQKTYPEDGIDIPPSVPAFLIGWMFLCMTGLVGPVANMAHVTGLVTGAVLAKLRRFVPFV